MVNIIFKRESRVFAHSKNKPHAPALTTMKEIEVTLEESMRFLRSDLGTNNVIRDVNGELHFTKLDSICQGCFKGYGFNPPVARKPNGEPMLYRCMGCLNIRYCSKECQKMHWKKHKLKCGDFKKTRDNIKFLKKVNKKLSTNDQLPPPPPPPSSST